MHYLSNIISYVREHRVVGSVVISLVLYFGYLEYKSITSTTAETRYVVSTAEKGVIVASITGSGQVSASNQLELKPKASGDVTFLGVVNGQQVQSGTLVVQLDATDAQKALRDAQVNLDSTKLALEKILRPADTLSLIQSENALEQASASLEKSYDDGFSSASNAFLNLPTIMSGMQDVLYGTTVNRGQENLSAYVDMTKGYDENVLVTKQDVAVKYQNARTMYDKTFAEYRSASRFSSRKEIETLINDTYETSKSVAGTVKSTNDLIGYTKDKLILYNKTVPAALTVHQNQLSVYIAQTNAALVDLLSIQTAMTTAKYSISEKIESLRKLKEGADSIDIQTTQLSLKQRENALLDAQENFSHYFVRAPFAGVIAKLNVKKDDTVSTATSVATLITSQKIAQVSLNEVDVAKVKIGQKVTLTFDAIEGLSIAGQVSDIDTVGTVSQGVVTYVVTIVFGTQDDRVKSGMSVSAAIITNMKQGIVMIPNSAVKLKGGVHYVELFDIPLASVSTSTRGVSGSSANNGTPSATPPMQQVVEIGISNDTMTEIISGINEGQQVVTRAIAGLTASTQAPSIFSAAGIRNPGVNTRGATGR